MFIEDWIDNLKKEIDCKKQALQEAKRQAELARMRRESLLIEAFAQTQEGLKQMLPYFNRKFYGDESAADLRPASSIKNGSTFVLRVKNFYYETEFKAEDEVITCVFSRFDSAREDFVHYKANQYNVKITVDEENIFWDQTGAKQTVQLHEIARKLLRQIAEVAEMHDPNEG